MARSQPRPLLVGRLTPRVVPVGRVPDIVTATKDAHARRFFNKDYTTCDDLLGAVSFWVWARFPRDSLADFLAAIVPASGWADTEGFDPIRAVRRDRTRYGDDFFLLHNGDWTKWETATDG